MRMMVAALAGVLGVSAAQGQSLEEQAITAAAMYIALAHGCTETLEEPGLIDQAQQSARQTFEAASLPQDSIDEFMAVDSVDKGLPEGMCRKLVDAARSRSEELRGQIQ